MVLSCSKQHDKAPKSPVTLNRVQIHVAWPQLECHGAPVISQTEETLLTRRGLHFYILSFYEKLILMNKICPFVCLFIYHNIEDFYGTTNIAYLSHPPVDNKFNLPTYFSVSRPLFFTLSVEICPPKCHQGGAVAGEVEVPTRGQRQVPGPGFTARLGQGLGSC